MHLVARCLPLAVCVVVTALALPQQLRPANTGRAFPCPDAGAISPCVCKYDDSLPEGEKFVLTCDAVTTDDLTKAFSAYYAVPSLDEFWLKNSDGITLGLDFSSGVSFKKIFLSNNKIDTIDDEAFSSSYGTLQSFLVSASALLEQEWPLPNFSSFTVLSDIVINGPYGDIPVPLQSTSLVSATLNLHFMKTLPASTFTDTPNLHTLQFDQTKLDSIPSNAFADLAKLKTLTIKNSKLTSLAAGALTLNTDSLESLDLSRNEITTILEGAIQFPAQTVPPNVNLASNLLNELPKTVFFPLLSIPATVDVTDNPLFCGCDLSWLTDDAVSEEFSRLEGLWYACQLDGTGYDENSVLDFIEYQCNS